MSNHYFPLTDDDRRTMLEAVGVGSFEELIKSVPPSLRIKTPALPDPLSEMEAVRHLRVLAERNGDVHKLSVFAGGGAYEHFIPAAVGALASRGEFMTAYTPYQAEASQGTLQAIFEYQTMMAEITGLDVSNASLYDGATALAEACMLATHATKRKEILISGSVHPEYTAVVKTYLEGAGRTVTEIPSQHNGLFDFERAKTCWSTQTAAIVVSSPNVFGLVDALDGVAEFCHARDGLLIATGNPMAWAYFRSPGEWDADVACGELQPLGNPVSYGGPYAGFLTARKSLMRRIPGRICGETVDRQGARAFTLTLQAREQHIRRERATSNICTNQALVALRSAIYLSLMGPAGLRQVAELNIERASYLRESLRTLGGIDIAYDGPVFNEFVVKTVKPAADILDALRFRNILAGIDLSRWFPKRRHELLVCATETKTRDDLDYYIRCMKEVA